MVTLNYEFIIEIALSVILQNILSLCSYSQNVHVNKCLYKILK